MPAKSQASSAAWRSASPAAASPTRTTLLLPAVLRARMRDSSAIRQRVLVPPPSIARKYATPKFYHSGN